MKRFWAKVCLHWYLLWSGAYRGECAVTGYDPNGRCTLVAAGRRLGYSKILVTRVFLSTHRPTQIGSVLSLTGWGPN